MIDAADDDVGRLRHQTVQCKIDAICRGSVDREPSVANLLHPGDLNGLSVIQYAVESLKVSQVIVCGHYGCGGIKAAVDGEHHGLIDHWLQPIRDTHERCRQELAGYEEGSARLDRLCELNVMAQVKRVAETPSVQIAWELGQDLQVHGLIYSLSNGRLRKLECSRTGPADPD